MSYTSFVKIIPKYFIFLAFVNGIVFFGACVLKHYWRGRFKVDFYNSQVGLLGEIVIKRTQEKEQV